MPNIKSQISRLKTNLRDQEKNTVRKSKLKTAVKKFNAVVDAKDPEKMKEAVKEISRALDSTARKGAIHKNKASRSKSRLQKKINKLTAPGK